MIAATSRSNSYSITLLLLITFSGLFMAPLTPAYSMEEHWQHIGMYEGVDLYRSLNETDGALPFKAVALLDVSYEKIVMTLVDAERKAQWAPKLKATAIHNQISTNCFEYSEYYTTPWPFKDREFLLTGTISYQRDRIVFTAINSQNQQWARDDHLLANIQELTFEVIPLCQGKTKVAFTFSGDLGGWIPDFVKTIIQKKWPVRFIQALMDHIAQRDSLDTDRYRSLQKSTLVVSP
jgi:hypothetical protein